MKLDQFSVVLHGWQNYYTLLGEAAATLTGLMFVAASLGSRLISDEDDPRVRTFITPTVIYFATVLLLSALMNMPAQSQPALTIQLAAVGSLITGYSISHLPCLRRFHQKERLKTRNWAGNLLLPAAAGLCLLGGAAELSRVPASALTAAAIGALLLIMVGIHNAWNAALILIGRTPS